MKSKKLYTFKFNYILIMPLVTNVCNHILHTLVINHYIR